MVSNLIEEAVEFYWGERCDDYEESCMCCKAWKDYDLLTTEIVKKLDNITEMVKNLEVSDD